VQKVKENLAEKTVVSVEDVTAPKPTEKKKGGKRKIPEVEGKAKAETQTVESNKQPFINPWGFIHLKADVLERFGAVKGAKTFISIEEKEGTLVIRKA